MNRYRVKVLLSSYVFNDVEAEDDEAALKAAQSRYSWNFDRRGEQIVGAEIVTKGPAGEPLVKCPTEWEIYTSMAGHAKVNAAITAAAQRCTKEMLKASKEQVDIGPKFVLNLANKHVKPVFKKYDKYGTGDTEPRANVASYLSRYAQELGGDADEIYDAVRWSL
jgi:hypothetical protein